MKTFQSVLAAVYSPAAARFKVAPVMAHRERSQPYDSKCFQHIQNRRSCSVLSTMQNLDTVTKEVVHLRASESDEKLQPAARLQPAGLSCGFIISFIRYAFTPPCINMFHITQDVSQHLEKGCERT